MAGLLGIDDSSDIGQQLQGLLSGLGPSDADRATAKQMALLNLGASLLGARRGYEMGTISQAIPQAMGTYTNTLTQLPKLRAEQLQGVIPLMQLIQQQQQMKRMSDALGAPNASPNIPTQDGAPSPFQQPGGAAASFGAALGSPQPAPATLPTQVPIPGAISPQQTQYNALANANIIGMAGGRPDMSAAIKAKFPTPVSGRPGGYMVNPVTMQATLMPKFPEGTDATQNADGTWSTRPISGALPAIAAAAGAQAGGAEAGKFPYQIVDALGPNNEPIKGYASQVFGQPPGAQPRGPQTQPQQPQQPQRSVTFAPTLSPQQRAAAMADAQRSGYPQMGYQMPPMQAAQTPPVQAPSLGTPTLGTGVVTGAGPLAVKAGEANIETGAKLQQGFNAENQGQASKQLEELQAARPIAYKVLSSLDNLERTDQKGIYTGTPQAIYKDAAMWTNSLLQPFGVQIDTSKITNSDTYDAALQTLVRGGLKQFPGGRIFQSEFTSALRSMPSAATTPEGRAAIRAQIGSAALDTINQLNSAQAANSPAGLQNWIPPAPITPQNYWQMRPQVMGLKPRSGLNATQTYDVNNLLKSGNPNAIRKVILGGFTQ